MASDLSKTNSAVFQSLDNSDDLLLFLNNLSASSDSLGIISIDWGGCPACGTVSPYVAMRNSLPHRYYSRDIDLHYGICNWRKVTGISGDKFAEPVTRCYKFLLYALRRQQQRYGASRKFETFTDLDSDLPDFRRPKFPQLIFLDGNAIDGTALGELKTLHGNGNLWCPFFGTMDTGDVLHYLQIHDLRFDFGEIDSDEKKTLEELQRALSGDLNLDFGVDEQLSKLFADALLLQITNYNLYAQPHDPPEHFMLTETLQSCDCVVDQFVNDRSTSKDCIFFKRSFP